MELPLFRSYLFSEDNAFCVSTRIYFIVILTTHACERRGVCGVQYEGNKHQKLILISQKADCTPFKLANDKTIHFTLGRTPVAFFYGYYKTQICIAINTSKIQLRIYAVKCPGA